SGWKPYISGPKKGYPAIVYWQNFSGTAYGGVTIDFHSPQRYPAKNPQIYFAGQGGVLTDNLESAALGLIHEALHTLGKIPNDAYKYDPPNDKGRQSRLNQSLVRLMCADQPIPQEQVTPSTIIMGGP